MGGSYRTRTLRARGVHVALLRGINVGGKNKLPMAELVAIFRDIGCEQVRTYIQSGNVVFAAERGIAERLADKVARAIRDRFGYQVPVVLRTAAQLATVAEDNPFIATGAEMAAQHVAFLADVPAQERLAQLDPGRSPGDEFIVRGRDVYLNCRNGMARTKLTNQYFDSRLATVSTMRNWRTVLKLHDLARESETV